jgi:hypothetical protein
MSNVIAQIGKDTPLTNHSLKLGDGDGSFFLGVANTGFAISYRYWKIEITEARDPEAMVVEMTNVYFLQNSVTQSVVGVTATGGLVGYSASNLLIEDASIWRVDITSPPVEILFDFGKAITLDEIKWRTTSNSENVDPTNFTIYGSNDQSSWIEHSNNSYGSLTSTRSEIIDGLFLDQDVYFNTIDPPEGGYTIYSNKGKLGPSITTAESDGQFVDICRSAFPEAEIETSEQGFFEMINSRSGPVCVDSVHETIVLDGCTIAVDASIPMSFPRLRIGTGGGDIDTWYNMRLVYNEDLSAMNLRFEPYSAGREDVYPEYLEDESGTKYINFLRGEELTQATSARFSTIYDIDSATISYVSATVELYCRFEDEFPDGVIFGFSTYGVHCYNGYIGFTTTNLPPRGQTNYDTYGFTASGVTGSFVNLTCVFSEDPYTNNKIFLNGVEQSLFQVYGQENSTNRNFNDGNGRLAWFERETQELNSLPFKVQVFRLYNRVLTDDEILINWQAFQNRFGLS